MKQKRSLMQELDLTRDGVAELTHWCILIALHQDFGIGAERITKVEQAATRLGETSLALAMCPNEKGAPSTDRSRALRESWMPEGVDPQFHVPVLRAPKNRREQQLRMAGDVAASIVWTLYAAGCIEELGFGAKRLNRLKEAALANYRQMNQEGHEDGLDVAMEHLRRCACDALKTEEILVENVPDDERVKQTERDYEVQKREFLTRAISQAAGRQSATPGYAVLSCAEMDKRIKAISMAGAPQENGKQARPLRR